MSKMNWQKASAMSLIASLLFTMGSVRADEDDDFPPRKRRVVVIDAEPNQIEDEEEIIRRPSRYWLGIQCEVSNDGVSIAKVVGDSPAANAGLKTGDLVRRINDVEIDDVKTLIDSVQSSNGKSLKVSVLRDEEVITVDVTPGKMPNRFTRQFPQRDFFLDFPNAERFFNSEDFDMHFVNPGFAFDGTDGFPENASIKIERKNDEPTKLTIERDGEKWVVDEGSVDKLPKDLQGWAKKMLRQSNNRFQMRPPSIRRFESFPNQIRQRFQIQKDERNDEIKELREEIRELRKLIEEMKKE